MPYFHNDTINLLLIHIPKTGGTSLESYFSEKYDIPLNLDSLYEDVEDNNFLEKETKIRNHLEVNATLQHLIYRTIMKYKDFFKIDCNDLEIITIVRNPYERIVSGFLDKYGPKGTFRRLWMNKEISFTNFIDEFAIKTLKKIR